MPHLRIGIKQIGNVVFGRVLEQSGIENGKSLCVQTGVIIRTLESVNSPQLKSDVLYVRGSGVDESDWFAYAFDDYSQALQAVKDIKALVRLVNTDEEKPTDDACGLEVIE